jgi:hypothetical protein
MLAISSLRSFPRCSVSGFSSTGKKLGTPNHSRNIFPAQPFVTEHLNGFGGCGRDLVIMAI